MHSWFSPSRKTHALYRDEYGECERKHDLLAHTRTNQSDVPRTSDSRPAIRAYAATGKSYKAEPDRDIHKLAFCITAPVDSANFAKHRTAIKNRLYLQNYNTLNKHSYTVALNNTQTLFIASHLPCEFCASISSLQDYVCAQNWECYKRLISEMLFIKCQNNGLNLKIYTEELDMLIC